MSFSSADEDPDALLIVDETAEDAAAAAAEEAERGGEAGKEVRLLPIRPRSRGARRSLRTFPVVTLHPRFPFNV